MTDFSEDNWLDTSVEPDPEPMTISPSLHGRVIKLESRVTRLQGIQYINLGATAICIGGLFMAARVTAKLIKATNQIVAALDQAATTGPPTMPQPAQRPPEDITQMRDAVINNGGTERSTTGYDPGPQEVSDEVRKSLEHDTNIDALFNSDDI